MTLRLAAIGAQFVAYLLFLWWRGGRGAPLAEDQTDELIARIKQRADKAEDGSEAEILGHLRLLAEDRAGCIRTRHRIGPPPPQQHCAD